MIQIDINKAKQIVNALKNLEPKASKNLLISEIEQKIKMTQIETT